jgi:hypothetical protein
MNLFSDAKSPEEMPALLVTDARSASDRTSGFDAGARVPRARPAAHDT